MFSIWNLKLSVQGLGFRASGLEFGVASFVFRVIEVFLIPDPLSGGLVLRRRRVCSARAQPCAPKPNAP